jgi:hypothetical protein
MYARNIGSARSVFVAHRTEAEILTSKVLELHAEFTPQA